MKTYFTLFILLLSLSSAISQSASPNPEDLTKLDFWVGQWDLTWEGGAGTNHIEKILDGRVIRENFAATEGKSAGYEGMSVSTFDGRDNKWHQTWVDDQGGYITLIGSMEGQDRIFQTTTPVRQPDGKTYIFRMRFTDIRPDSFVWTWEQSPDNGTTWEESWKINYQRRASGPDGGGQAGRK